MTLNLTNVTSPVSLVTWVNNQVNGMFGIGLLFSLMVVTFLTLKMRGFDSSVCALASTFGCMIVSILLITLNWIPENVLVVTISLFIASFLWVSMSKR